MGFRETLRQTFRKDDLQFFADPIVGEVVLQLSGRDDLLGEAGGVLSHSSSQECQCDEFETEGGREGRLHISLSDAGRLSRNKKMHISHGNESVKCMVVNCASLRQHGPELEQANTDFWFWSEVRCTRAAQRSSTRRKPFLQPAITEVSHLTAQLSKVAERLVLPILETHISHTVASGPNQFAHMKGRGARDALAFLVMSWILALNRRKSVAVYCSDVSGAFDRVRAERLLEKLRFKGVSSPGLGQSGGVLAAATNRSGGRGGPTIEQDATQKRGVPGHRAWPHTLESTRQGFVEIVYADDLNGFRELEHNVNVDSVMTEAKKCQIGLHKWGKAMPGSTEASANHQPK